MDMQRFLFNNTSRSTKYDYYTKIKNKYVYK